MGKVDGPKRVGYRRVGIPGHDRETDMCVIRGFGTKVNHFGGDMPILFMVGLESISGYTSDLGSFTLDNVAVQ